MHIHVCSHFSHSERERLRQTNSETDRLRNAQVENKETEIPLGCLVFEEKKWERGEGKAFPRL